MELLRTKFYPPPLRPEMVRRPRLGQRLDEGVAQGRPLALVSAPAGYGKSTLVAAWLQGKSMAARRSAWLSLEAEDDELQRFFTYLIAALREAGLALEAAGQNLQGVGQAQPAEALVTSLLNAIGAETNGRPLVLVLDDYHKLESPRIHQALQFWLEHAPPGLQLVLVTREDPPLTLARWRVGNQMTEIRAADLRFTEAEAATFLQKTMGLALTEADVAALEGRTEGWIAGLQLAAIALQAPGQGDPAAFIRAFSGSHRYVIDYLVEEVLRQQEGTVRTFLEQTAVLERLSAPLCNAVSGRADSGAMLAQLERQNLFLIPLDAERRWYRYHHLLADSLRAGLAVGEAAELHRRAAGWYEQQGHPAAAVRHALATGDLNLAADVMERVIQEAAAWSEGEVARLNAWLDALPTYLLRARPALGIHASRALYLAGQMERSRQLLAQAEQALRQGPAATEEKEGLLALAGVYRAATDAMRGEGLAEAVREMRRLLRLPGRLDLHTAARAADTLGLAHELRGELREAEQAYVQAGEVAEAAGVHYLALNARCEAALVQIEQGQLAQAEESCRAALALVGEEKIAPAGLARAVLGEIARERNRLAEAEAELSAGIELGEAGGIGDDLRHAYLFLARLKQAQGEAEAAVAAWQQADRLLRGYRVPRLAAVAAAERARLDLAQGKVAQAQRWVEGYEQLRPDTGNATEGDGYLREREELTLARVYLATGDTSGALALLAATLAAAQAGGRTRTVIEAFIVQALALDAQGERAAAEQALAEALLLAAPAGFVRLFVDGGAAVAALLPGVAPVAPPFVQELLAAFAEEGVPAAAERGELVPPPAHLVEPLSEREAEVLALLVEGLTNREIGEALVITEGTVKWHVHNIYQKLGVSGRAEAIARTHEWGLLPGS